MKRRELIKLGSAILGSASIGAVTGYGINSALNSKDNEIKTSDNKLIIEPKQLAPYDFSCPMPFDKKLIDKIVKINNGLKKGKITTMYSSLPAPLSDKIHPVFASLRGENESVKTVDDYIDYIKYAQDKGFRCVYILNTTQPVDDEDAKTIKAIDSLFEKLRANGIKDVKVSNINLMNIFTNHIKDIDIHLSTLTEYHTIQNYYNIIKTYPNIKSINIAVDDNHNFKFLTSLRKMFPKVKLEILVNESRCIKNCPARFYHANTPLVSFPCKKYINDNPHLHIARNNLVHPWQLDYYSAIGINNFKISCNEFGRNHILSVRFLKHYLDCVENGVEKYSANDFIDKIHYSIPIYPPFRFKEKYSLAKLIEYLPDMGKLVELGANCANDCGTKCRYCYNCAEKLKDLVEKA